MLNRKQQPQKYYSKIYEQIEKKKWREKTRQPQEPELWEAEAKLIENEIKLGWTHYRLQKDERRYDERANNNNHTKRNEISAHFNQRIVHINTTQREIDLLLL